MVARARNLVTIGFSDAKSAEILASLCDYCLAIPSNDTPRIQEAHEFVWHYLCGTIEARLFPTAPH